MSSPSPVSARIYRVALEGFSDFERTALASFFRLADRHTPAYVQVDDASQADFSVVNADQAALVQRLVAAQRLNHAVFVGAGAPAEAIARVARPIEPAQILRGLDQLVALRAMRFGLDMEVAPAATGPTAVPARAPANARVHASMPPPSSVDVLLQDIVSPGRGGGRAALVVDDSAIARKFLAARLQRLGYVVHVASSGAEALRLATAQTFAVVFLDTALGGSVGSGAADGLQICQQLRLQSQNEGAHPAIVLVTSAATSAERVRGSLAGCDGYLSKPLLEPEFLEVLASVDPAFGDEAVSAAG